MVKYGNYFLMVNSGNDRQVAENLPFNPVIGN